MADKIDLRIAVKEVLDAYVDEVDEALPKAIERTARKTAKELRAVSPKKAKGRKSYASGWTVKNTGSRLGATQSTVYNRTKPGLAHLLEHGHVTRNGKGTYGRTPAHSHIAGVNDQVEGILLTEVEKAIK